MSNIVNIESVSVSSEHPSLAAAQAWITQQVAALGITLDSVRANIGTRQTSAFGVTPVTYVVVVSLGGNTQVTRDGVDVSGASGSI